jgi:membrane-associated protease RseP (regulator of RpoE activity)
MLLSPCCLPCCLQRGEVEYSLRAIPLGGYVAFPDDDPKSSYAPDDPNLLQNRSVVERGIVISAGVIANVIFALAILFAQVGFSSTRGAAVGLYLCIMRTQ